MESLIFEYSERGKNGVSLPDPGQDFIPENNLPEELIRKSDLDLPEVSEPEVVRHFIRLSNMNHHVDKDLYPLGSCTMKYNPKINDLLAVLPGFRDVHPHQPEATIQGALQIMYDLEHMLCEITGMEAATLQPAAGAHGELTGIMVMKKYHEKKGNKKNLILIPDSSHGTNPSSVCSIGLKTVSIKSDETGCIDIDDLKLKINESVAGLMLTNPNTLGLFERDLKTIVDIVHQYDGLVYMDGANLNALLGIVRPGDMGFDITHMNLHKTFSTPHGGGGPGGGPIAVVKRLAPFLPVPRILKSGDKYSLSYDYEDSVGKVLGFYGNFGVMIRACVYILMLGLEGLKQVSRNAILNANYIRSKICDTYNVPFNRPCMHEFVASGESLRSFGVKTLDIAKRLLDYGFHAPTIYFPLIVKEALMIEPTESESKKTLDKFSETLLKIAEEAEDNPELLHEAPHSTPVRRLNELKANKELDVCWGDR